MTAKEALKGMCDLSKVDDEHFRMWVGLKGEVEQAITELETLKRDVKRYFELDNKHGCTLREIDEWLNLERKLMKVGKKE